MRRHVLSLATLTPGSSEVVGRPLAALLANDGARVFSADIDSIQEYTKRAPTGEGKARARAPRHAVHPCKLALDECLALSDVVVSAVPHAEYKVSTAALKDGVVCVNVAAEKNFEADVREKVRERAACGCGADAVVQAAIYVPAVGKGGWSESSTASR